VDLAYVAQNVALAAGLAAAGWVGASLGQPPAPRSQHSPAGLPDCLWVNRRRPGVEGLLVAELKRECTCRPGRVQCRYHPSPEQDMWMAWLTAIGVSVFLWRPSDYYSGAMARTIARFAA
jgi:hypothetical protein